MSLNKESLNLAANEARGLAMDAITACKSGHMGLPLGAAEIGAALYGKLLNIHPDYPKWLNRDRFILSAGHGSMFLYSWLHLAGYDLSIDDLKAFRKLNSKTPGHPEFGQTAGVEATTGPLGQGIGNAVGIALACKMAADRYNTSKHKIFTHKAVCLAGDGCIQEGVSQEASAFAGHFGLDNLIIFYDDNDITLDAPAAATQSENTAQRYEAYGFDVYKIDGHNLDEICEAYTNASEQKNGRPKFIMAKTIAGKGITELAGTYAAHGEAGVKYVPESRKALGLPDETFFVSEETRKYFETHKAELHQQYSQWEEDYQAWRSENDTLASELDTAIKQDIPADLSSSIPEFDNSSIATRAAGEKVLNALASQIPVLVSGSADLHGSTKNYIKDAGDFTAENNGGKNLLFGIREHAMGAILNGFGYYGIFRASGATFLTFSDYMRPSVRMAGLSQLPVFYIWTHDSVGVGEDGPTHQPVEVISSLRLIPELDVIRPGDPEETAGAYIAALQRNNGPTALILSRQGMPNLTQVDATIRRQGVLKGAYIIHHEETELQTIIMATGSELAVAIDAAKQLGTGTRVVSFPCMERFERQPQNYKDEILPPACNKRISIEAGCTALWHKWIGSAGKAIGIDRFGLSAPCDIVMKKLGISVENLIQEAKQL